MRFHKTFAFGLLVFVGAGTSSCATNVQGISTLTPRGTASSTPLPTADVTIPFLTLAGGAEVFAPALSTDVPGIPETIALATAESSGSFAGTPTQALPAIARLVRFTDKNLGRRTNNSATPARFVNVMAWQFEWPETPHLFGKLSTTGSPASPTPTTYLHNCVAAVVINATTGALIEGNDDCE